MSSLYCSQGHRNVPGSRYCFICGELLPAAPTAAGGLSNATMLGQRYRIVRQLGAGGFGRTYLAEDQNRFQELCVLKEFAPQVEGPEAITKAKQLFEREAGVLYQLRHPQIPRFRELLQSWVDGHLRLFLVQDYVEGPTYQQILEERRLNGHAFGEGEVLALLAHLLPVLHYIHGQGVIHRDISPDNLILRSPDQLPILIDFGGVKQIAASLASHYGTGSQAVTRLGKVGYAPPEQMDTGRVAATSDLYALAMTALVLLSGKEPHALGDITTGDWKRQVTVSPPLRSVLERMLGVDLRSRFTSAEQALQALPQDPAPMAAAPPASHLERTRAIAPAAPPPPAGRTAAATVATPTAANPASRPWDSAAVAAILATVLLTGGVVGALWATRESWIPLFTGSSEQTTSNSTERPSEPASLSPEEQDRKAAIRTRQQELGVDSRFLIRLTDDEFFRRYPEMAGRSLTQEAADATWRERWDAIALDWLDWFEANLSTQARRRLGSYGESDRNGWKREVNQLNVSSRALNDLTDARFFQSFPEWRDQDFIGAPVGQVWQAVAFDQLQGLKGGDRLTRIRFQSGEYSQSLSGELAPGAGQVYIADLKQGQPLRLNLEASSDAARLSFYLPVPTQALPVLLEDSSKTQWSGELPQSGYYEIVIVSRRDQPFRYTLNLAADEVSTQPTEESRPTPDADLDLPIAPNQRD